MPLNVRTLREWASDLLLRGRLTGGGSLRTAAPDPDEDPIDPDPRSASAGSDLGR
jgi:hypothetical protein